MFWYQLGFGRLRIRLRSRLDGQANLEPDLVLEFVLELLELCLRECFEPLSVGHHGSRENLDQRFVFGRNARGDRNLGEFVDDAPPDLHCSVSGKLCRFGSDRDFGPGALRGEFAGSADTLGNRHEPSVPRVRDVHRPADPALGLGQLDVGHRSLHLFLLLLTMCAGCRSPRTRGSDAGQAYRIG